MKTNSVQRSVYDMLAMLDMKRLVQPDPCRPFLMLCRSSRYNPQTKIRQLVVC